MASIARIIGTRVRASRKAHGWTQQALADRMGMRQGGIARIEAGQNKQLEVGTLIALARALDVSLEHLVGMDDADAVVTTGAPGRLARGISQTG